MAWVSLGCPLVTQPSLPVPTGGAGGFPLLFLVSFVFQKFLSRDTQTFSEVGCPIVYIFAHIAHVHTLHVMRIPPVPTPTSISISLPTL